MNQTPKTIERDRYISADAIPALAEMRATERAVAESVMTERVRQIEMGEFKERPIDALSEGQRVIAAGILYGEGSREQEEARHGLFMSSLRMLGEWRRKIPYEYFKPIRHKRDPVTGDFLADGRSTMELTNSALIPSKYKEEDQRRVNERLEDITSVYARKLGGFALGQTIKQRTVSECADWSIDVFKETGKSLGGYVPENKKLIIRDMTIEGETDDRLEEQVALPGEYINHYVIVKSLQRRAINAASMDKTELQGNQLFVGDDLLEFVALLDEVASEEWCVPIFMGEILPEGQVKNYEAVRAQAIEREKSLENHARMVADFVMSLCEQNCDPDKAPELVEEFVKQIMISLAQENLSITTEMFDTTTQVGLQEVRSLQNTGQLNEAWQKLNEVIQAAPGGGYCGAGSCELVRAAVAGREAEKIKKLGFDPKHTLEDKGDRKCGNPKCRQRTVVYDLKLAAKGCTSCGTTVKY